MVNPDDDLKPEERGFRPEDTVSFFHPDTEINPDLIPQDAIPPLQEGLVPGLEIPGYTLVREISKGGQAVIFLATQNSTGRKVAIKLLLDGPVESQVERTRMDREVRVLSELDHPNIVSIIDRGITRQGLNFFVMEYLKGSILSEYMDEYRSKYPPWGLGEDNADLFRLFIRICETVNAAHLRGIVHRDLKPANIIIDSYGEPHIFDFGVASGAASWLITEAVDPEESGAREFLGSLPWASPEQAEGDMSKIDTRTDVYSLGVILYEMLTGDFPYEVFNKPVETLFNIRNAIPIPPARMLTRKIEKQEQAAGGSRKRRRKSRNPIDPTLDAIVMKALEKRRDRRYQTAGALAQDLGKYIAGQPVSVTGRAARTNKPTLLMPFLGGLALVGVVSGLIYMGINIGRENAEQALPVLPTGMTPIDENFIGYSIKGKQLLFEFRPSLMDTVRLANGSLGQLSDVRSILSVSVAGPFNDWDPMDPEWKLQRFGEDLYVLARPISDFEGQSQWPFKYVVNGTTWVSAPALARNKEIVPEDAATYNFILTNPGAVQATADKQTVVYRDQIDQQWLGVGANLAREGNGYFLSLTHLPPGLEIRNLEPLRGIPLSSLDMVDINVTDFSPLKTMTSLKELTINDNVYRQVTENTIKALGRLDFAGARMAIDAFTSQYVQVPVFHRFRELLMDSIAVIEELRTNPGRIPYAVRTFEGHAYAFIVLPLNWKEAYSWCKKYGAHLATITSEDELNWIKQEFAAASMGRTFWLGGSDQREEGRWEWTSGESWEFEHWMAQEPNNRDGQEHHLSMKHDGWWHDANGDAARIPFLMEWDSVESE